MDVDCCKVVYLDEHGERMISSGVAAMRYCCVEYEIGRFTHAPEQMLEKGYGLCAFQDLDSALLHMNAMSTEPHKYRLFKAVGRGSMALPRFMTSAGETDVLFDARKVEFGANEMWCDEVKVFAMEWPEGTLMFQEIMLVEEIKER